MSWSWAPARAVKAKELASGGMRVVLLERGRQQKYETGHDELRSQRTTTLGNAFGPDDERHLRLVKLGDDTEFRETLPSEGGYGNVAACVGGGTTSYGAMAWRFLEKDFRMRSTYGAPEGSTLRTGPSAIRISNPITRRPSGKSGFRARPARTLSKRPVRRAIRRLLCP